MTAVVIVMHRPEATPEQHAETRREVSRKRSTEGEPEVRFAPLQSQLVA